MKQFLRWRKRNLKGSGGVSGEKVKSEINGMTNAADAGDETLGDMESGVGSESMEAVENVPIGDIIELSCEFHAALREHTDLAHKRRFVATMKSLASQMMQQSFRQKTLDEANAKMAIVKRMLTESPAVRARLALAIQRFCLVTEWEMENEELENGTGLLATLRGEVMQLRTKDAGSIAHVMSKIPHFPEFDAAKVYHQVLTTNELPSLGEMAELLRRTTQVLRREPNVVTVTMPCVVVGDIHGQKRDLIESIFAAGGPLNVDEKENDDSNVIMNGACSSGSFATAAEDKKSFGKRDYLFLGDYIDRGPQSLHCVALLFAAKLLAPNHVFMLRGNHESTETNRSYGFLKECYERYPVDAADSSNDAANDIGDMEVGLKEHPLWVLANEAFRSLPLCAVTIDPPSHTKCGKGMQRIAVCAMHGGLSPFISESLDGILAVERFRDIEDGPLADLTWSDPVVTRETAAAVTEDKEMEEAHNCDDGEGGMNLKGTNKDKLSSHRVVFDYAKPVPTTAASVGYVYSSRGRGHNFGEDVTLRFLRANQVGFIVRAHQCVKEGYQWQHHRRLLTLFSAPNYCGLGNKGAILILHGGGEPELIQFEAVDTAAVAETAPSPVPPKNF